MKKQLSLAMAGVMALSLAACGGSSASSAATSTAEAASSAAESTAESTAAEGDVLDQAAAAAFAQDVTLTMWGAEEDQDLLRESAISSSRSTATTAARSPSIWELSPSPRPRIPS